jgi:hypothetical protein
MIQTPNETPATALMDGIAQAEAARKHEHTDAWEAVAQAQTETKVTKGGETRSHRKRRLSGNNNNE